MWSVIQLTSICRTKQLKGREPRLVVVVLPDFSFALAGFFPDLGEVLALALRHGLLLVVLVVLVGLIIGLIGLMVFVELVVSIVVGNELTNGGGRVEQFMGVGIFVKVLAGSYIRLGVGLVLLPEQAKEENTGGGREYGSLLIGVIMGYNVGFGRRGGREE